ncbi:DUF3021 domain-containing protein [Lactobacillus sp. W8093]|uniref:DUF3021 domain-containing protein n=1 Tax=Lactobacillus sp. W8093 TaxID=2751038 RepID=UPI0018EFA245|nr:DUF3021 domain-containing protein [Lactobacillus sp. W8093]MBI0111143.1 DUF3021 domain-containing protein [Lactobacillus sp. W8093]
MKNIKKFINYIFRFSAEGTLYGLIVSLFFNFSNKNSVYYPSVPSFSAKFATPLNAMTVSVILWSLMGLVFGFGSFVFVIRQWSILKRTIVSFIIYYIGFTPLAFLAGWFPANIVNFMIFTGLFILIYVAVWFIRSYRVIREIREINNKIKKK